MELLKVQHKILANKDRLYWVTFSGLIIYRSLLALQGFELCDSGWYATFYQNFFENPSTVESNFLFWLTGLIGGTFMKILPGSGLLGLRFLGVAFLGLTMVLVFKLLRNRVKIISLCLGIMIVVISLISVPAEFYHNDLSSLLFVMASLLLYWGLKSGYLMFFSFSGIILALNVFARLPNVLDLVLILIIIINSIYNKENWGKCLKKIIVLLVSFITAVFSVILIMKLLGHYDIFIRSLSGLAKVAKGDMGSTHGVSEMIRTNISAYISVFRQGIASILSIFIAGYFLKLFFSWSHGKIRYLGVLIAAVFMGYFIWKFAIINILYFFSLTLLCWNIYSKENDLKVLSWLGLFMLVIMPLGSDFSIHNFGNYAIWIAVPIAVDSLIFDKLTLDLRVAPADSQKFTKFRLENYYIKIALVIFLGIFLFRILYLTFNYSYFDPGNRLLKTHVINNEKANGIFTTSERALIINDLLDNVERYVEKGDYLIAYESIPMIHYLTETRPYLFDSWLVNSVSVPLEQKILRAKEEKQPLPLVLRQKFETIGNFGEPSDLYISDERESTMFVSQDQTKLFNQFLVNNNYKVIWSNEYFILYEPQTK